MSPRSQSGYDPAGDSRTGRPPLPNERERSRQMMPDAIDPKTFPQSRPSPGGTESESEEEDSKSMVGKIASGTSGAAQTLRSAGETVTSQVSAATTVALERGSALASTASEQVQTYASELVAFARRRPLTAMVGAAVLGLLVGMFRRNRSSD